MAGQAHHEEFNPRLPSWTGDWSTFKAYELKVGLEVDATKEEDLVLLGPRLAKNLGGKAWEYVEEVDREALKKKDGAQYLLKYLKAQRGRDRVDLLGDALTELFGKAEVQRKEGEEFVDYLPRYRQFVKAIDVAFQELRQDAPSMPREFFGWHLLTMGMRLEPSDVANIKARAKSYNLTEIENTIRLMWSGGGLAQKDQERKRWRSLGNGKAFHALGEDDGHSSTVLADETFGEARDDESENDDYDQLRDLAAAVVDEPYDAEVLIAFQEAQKKVSYREARKLLAKSRTSREYYPVTQGKGSRDKAKRENKSDMVTFHGDCVRCGKYGHRARDCPQKGKPKGGSETNHYIREATDAEKSWVVFSESQEMTPEIFAAQNGPLTLKGIIDSGASETIIGVETLQELQDAILQLKLDPKKHIDIDRSLRKTFVFGNSESSEALGLCKLVVGLLGVETTVEAHVVEGSAPLLLSSRFLYKHGVSIDFKQGIARFAENTEQPVQLERAPSYHLQLSMLDFPKKVANGFDTPEKPEPPSKRQDS